MLVHASLSGLVMALAIIPSTELLGYFQPSLRDEDSATSPYLLVAPLPR
jgi:hypothetical protein